jgi:serine/threonine protein kinase
MAEGNVGGTSDGTRLLSQESSATVASSTSSEYFSTRIQSMVESRSEYATALEAEIDASRVHWSELQAGNGGRGSAKANLELYRSLQEQYGGPGGFFKDWNDDVVELGEKIAEGAQGEIFLIRVPGDAALNEVGVLKLFKEGSSLEDLQKQWPPGMLLKTVTSGDHFYKSFGGSGGYGGTMLKDGRFGFITARFWGDFRKVIDLRMQHNGNQAPPFSDEIALKIMHSTARQMRWLHRDNIVHRDLKASNVLILPKVWIVKTGDGTLLRVQEFKPVNDNNFRINIADFECSVGVVGTRFWRAPEILQGVKNRCVEPSLFTEKSDVYSYAMTCCEVLTGKIPLENVAANDYDAILLHGARPQLPSGLEPWIRSLLERCWDHDLSKRPSFEEIVLEFEGRKIKLMY